MTEQPIIVVRGEAYREVPPEQAVLSVTASARDKDRETSLRLLTARAAEVRSILDDFAAAIDKRDTAGVQLYPEVRRRGERGTVYVAHVTTSVTVTDFAVLGDLLLRLGALDQTTITGPWWQLRPGSRAGADVRREAIADAAQRAKEYAEAVGAEIDRLIEIADEGTGGSGGMMRAMAVGYAKDSSEEMTLDVEPQAQTVTAAVVVKVTITEAAAFGA